MTKYTASKKADKKVAQDMKIVTEILVKRLHPVSVMVFGGFGRGEGSFEIVKGKVVPLNDYDVYVITEKKVPDAVLEKIGIECSGAIGKGGGEFVSHYSDTYDKKKYFHVDLRCLTINELKHLHRTNRTHELKYGSLIIYGEDVRKYIRNITIPPSEAFRYLINPACHLLLVMDERRWKSGFKKDEKFYVLHHIIKAYLAIASSMIISAGSFKPNYRTTNAEFQKIYGKKFPELAKRIAEATMLKITPRKEMKAEELQERWKQAREDILFSLQYGARKKLNIDASDVKELTRKLYQKLPFWYFGKYLPERLLFLDAIAFPVQYFFNILYFRNTRRISALLHWKDTGLRIFMAALLLLYAREDESLLGEAEKYIKTFAPLHERNWEGLRKSLLYGFDKYFSQKII